MKTRNRTVIGLALGLATVVGTLCLAQSEAEAQRIGGGRVSGGRIGGGRTYYGGNRTYGGVYGGRVYGGGVYGGRYGGGYYGGGYYGARVYGGGAYGPRVYVGGPVLVPPAVVVGPPVAYGPAPVMVAPVAQPPVMISTRPMGPVEPTTVWGVGLRGLFVGEKAGNAGGIGGHIRLRSGRWAGFEVSADYMRVGVAKTTRQDVPVMAAFMLYLLPYRFAPYLLVGGGINFAHSSFANGISDRAEQIAAQAGGGLELRLNRHIALTADLRYIYRTRLGDSQNAAPVIQNIGTEHGAQLLVGGTFYF
jgi:hypothetical protein